MNEQDIYIWNLNEKVAYSKMELRNRIGDGGRIFESQKEYAAYVNQVLFGFETMDEYREINDILGNSLQTLSEDDLRPMSEAIENMDGLKTNLDNLKESLEAAKQIQNDGCLKRLQDEKEQSKEEIKEDMKYQKKAVYQESMLENYILQ